MTPEARERKNARVKKWYQDHPGKDREHHLKNKYGITSGDYVELLAKQGGVCAICGNPELTPNHNGKERHLAVDHNHITGKVRGLLCYTCNMAIGYMKEDPVRLLAAVNYLDEHNGEISNESDAQSRQARIKTRRI